MKIVIDISKDTYSRIKSGNYITNPELDFAIQRGIPYEPKGDLISRDALKQMLPAPIEDEYKHVHQIIDNAPTVEAYTSEDLVKYISATEDLVREKLERPQGEWIKWKFKDFGALGDWEYKCSKCEKVYGGEYNFCPNCGAKMKGDKL